MVEGHGSSSGGISPELKKWLGGTVLVSVLGGLILLVRRRNSGDEPDPTNPSKVKRHLRPVKDLGYGVQPGDSLPSGTPGLAQAKAGRRNKKKAA